ncbi:MAG: hypothetical protein A2Y97_02610 [Nitrospirae bacterium RBG_13_39_12]|nr:MAG: hypothetical protein A2Y97_02610 [Nitrospirae bacterium RBG_13_39_12]
MEEFKYKQYTDEENKIYYEAMAKIMDGLKNGLSFNEACNDTYVEDKELKEFIKDDALKIMIADLHYMKGLSLPDVADILKVPIESINKANLEMLDDIEITSREFYKMKTPGNPIGNA